MPAPDHGTQGRREPGGTRTDAELRGEQGRWDEDLGAVGAVGVPSAGGVSFDAEAVVDLGVVAFAEQPGVLQAGLAAEDPLDEVVDLAPIAGGITAGEDAVAVSDLDGFAHGGWHEADGAAHVE